MPAAPARKLKVGDRVRLLKRSDLCSIGYPDLTGEGVIKGSTTRCASCVAESVSRVTLGSGSYCWPTERLELLPPEETKRKPKVGDVVDVSTAHLLSVDGQRILNTVDERPQLKLKARDTRFGQHWLGFKGREYLFKEEDITRYHD